MKLTRDWVGQAYYSSFTSNSRGVAILIHRAIPFVLNKEVYLSLYNKLYNKIKMWFPLK